MVMNVVSMVRSPMGRSDHGGRDGRDEHASGWRGSGVIQAVLPGLGISPEVD